MHNTSVEMLHELSFSPRQREIFKLYSQRIRGKIIKLKDDIRRQNGLTNDSPLGEQIDGLDKESLKLDQDLSLGIVTKVHISKVLGFWFVDEIQSDLMPIDSLTEESFPYVPRQDVRSLGSEGTFYELLYLFYKLGVAFIRTEGATAVHKYHQLKK
jgi:hypothetical protein